MRVAGPVHPGRRQATPSVSGAWVAEQRGRDGGVERQIYAQVGHDGRTAAVEAIGNV